MSNYISLFYVDEFIYPCPNPYDDLATFRKHKGNLERKGNGHHNVG